MYVESGVDKLECPVKVWLGGSLGVELLISNSKFKSYHVKTIDKTGTKSGCVLVKGCGFVHGYDFVY